MTRGMKLEPLANRADQRTPDLRASDAERAAVIEQLQQHCTDGRLSLDEYSERVATVFAARTVGQLLRVLDDLPATRVWRTSSPRLLAGHVLAFVSGSAAMFATWQWNNPSILFTPTIFPHSAAWPAIPVAVWATALSTHAGVFLFRTRRRTPPGLR